MKRIICILLALLCFVLPVAAEGNPFSPYGLTAPEGVACTETEGTHTFVQGLTRVVAMVIERVPDEKPQEAIIRMMAQFEPAAVIGEDLPVAEGFVGLTALNTDKFGSGVDQLTVMVLSAQGDLLILSGYDLQGDEEKVQTLLDALLSALTADGMPVVITEEK